MGISWFNRKLFHMGELRNVQEIDQKSQDSNTVIQNSKILSMYQGFKGNQNALYVPYNHKYYDKGWGCAWRAIQMVLSPYYKPYDILESQGLVDFKKLFLEYGKKGRLNKIVDSFYPQKIGSIIKQSSYAPEEVSNNWAEPFICHLICQDRNIKSKLFLLNDYPFANAPREAFTQKVTNFNEFITLIDQHIQFSPVMIDDGIISMTILAYRKGQANQHELIIGDPHILSNKTNPMEIGIYKIVLDESGKKVREDINAQVFKQAYCNNMNKIDFSKKAWMFMLTQRDL